MANTKEQNFEDDYIKSLSPRKQKKLEKKEARYQQRYGISYIELKQRTDKNAKKFSNGIFKKYWAKYNKKLVIIYIILFAISLCSLIPTIFYQRYLDTITVTPPIWETGLLMVVGFCAVTLFNKLLSRLTNYYLHKTLNSVVRDMRNDLCTKLMSSKYTNFKNRSTGFITSRISNAPSQYAFRVKAIFDSIGTLITSVVFIVYAFIIAPGLAGVIFGFSLLELFADLFYTNVFYKIQVQRGEKISENRISLYNEAIRGIYDVKLLNNEESIATKLETNNNYQFNTTIDAVRSNRSFGTIYDFLYVLKWFLVYTFTIVFLQNDIASLSACLVIFSYSGNITSFFNTLQDMYDAKVDVDVYRGRIADILDDKLFQIEKFGDVSISKIKGKIEFLDVDFAYADDQGHPVLNNISFEIKPNECVGFVGASGAGKSTIASLIPRIYDPTSGKITIDDIDAKDLDKNTLRGGISVVSQSPYIFNLSFKENLLAVKQDATDGEIVSVLKKAQLYDLIQSRPEGLDTIVGEGGLQLSGGQKQRLAIARALLKNSKILIFDEATSALDNKTQTEIQTVIKKLQKSHTIIIIAHRLSTIVDCDRLFFVSDGKILANGTHKELLKTCKEYRDMYKFEDYISTKN